ncbi:MAG: deoxynucleoside kinase [Candidatus Marinimicrobia bacterium]|nr:deoxynucleoside kinase [Candidatus Neomarinimicrobiota bacterium]MCD6100333.1 deoxynucleoside kinase [Candidatus Neomarinimicrobiota bacterium]
MKNIYYIAIEGVIGVGKTSLAKILSEELSAKIVLERFEENPFLEDFYVDPERYAFQTQMFFLLSRYRQQMEFKQFDLFSKLVVSDYMFQKDKLFASINLNEREFELYNSVYKLLERDVLKPDLVIFLQASVDRLMHNIRKRGRSYERYIQREYIESLVHVYNEFFFFYKDSPLLIINTEEMDFVNNKDDLNDILKVVKEPFEGVKYYNPTRRLLK